MSNRSVPFLQRVAQGTLPRLHQYYQRTPTPCMSSARTSLPSLGRTTAALWVRSAPGAAPPGGQGFARGARPLLFPWNMQGLPGSWEIPRPHAPLSVPGGPFGPSLYGPFDIAFRNMHNVGSASIVLLSRLNHAAYALLSVRFAARITPGPRNTRFRLVASLGRDGSCTHRDFSRDFNFS